MSIDIGSPAPAFTLETADGPVSLFGYAGKKLVLYFYPKDDTAGCTTEAIQFSGLLSQFAAAGTAVLGVSKDTVAKHRKFAAKHALTVALGSDPEGAVIEAYGSWVEKTLYGRKYMGIDRSTFLIGPDGRISAIWRKVKVAGHAEAVLKAAQAL
ncbi:peroxiredoxin [Sandaracinobacter neustonicus]|uniref:thioredoxin-dependent peroxiredoxin n=1 Tax=Sandaracinobacter neustonicus TaxID=1715348 RepID=A0A501XK55_9SPHN|nr:peroxiredoxin [Sandaracinobacter neustonicus]TPE61062.1 peroxiredoxin [Sandaracinobacter neustonicus]